MTEEEARHRHMQLNGIRLVAIITVAFGIAIISGKLIDEPAFGYFLFVLGAVEFFAMPWWLAKQWKKTDE